MEAIVAEVIDTGDRDSRGRRRMSAAQRADYVRADRESRLSQAALAKREGLCYSTFAHWVQKAAKGMLRMTPSPSTPTPRHGPVQFTQVQSQSAVTSPSASVSAPLDTASMELRLPDGVVVRGADVQKLAALVRSLRSKSPTAAVQRVGSGQLVEGVQGEELCSSPAPVGLLRDERMGFKR